MIRWKSVKRSRERYWILVMSGISVVPRGGFHPSLLIIITIQTDGQTEVRAEAEDGEQGIPSTWQGDGGLHRRVYGIGG